MSEMESLIVDNCIQCGRELEFDETALHKKLFGKTATAFMCKTCCAEYFEVDETVMDMKIKQYKEVGCKLFEKNI